MVTSTSIFPSVSIFETILRALSFSKLILLSVAFTEHVENEKAKIEALTKLF